MACFLIVLASGHCVCSGRGCRHQQRLANSRLDGRARHNGGACSVNAFRCGRVHCYLTGPFFFLMALIASSYGLGILRLGGMGWNLLGLITLIGTAALWYLPEMLWGKYRNI